MCRILAITSFDHMLHATIIDDFFALAHSGRVPPNNELGHLDGWGIGYYADGAARVIKSGGSIMAEKDRFYAAINNITASPVLIVHLRKSAWSGSTNERHAHPFVFNNYLLAHNGVVTDYQSLLEDIPPADRPAFDALDTEVWFRHIISRPADTLSGALLASSTQIHNYHLFTAMNCVLTDGTTLAVLRDCTKWPDYYSLYQTTVGTSHIICSEPIGTINWAEIPLATPLSFVAEK